MGYPCERCGTPERREDREVVRPQRVPPLVVSRYVCPACEGAVPIIHRPPGRYPGMIDA